MKLIIKDLANNLENLLVIKNTKQKVDKEIDYNIILVVAKVMTLSIESTGKLMGNHW